MTLKELSQLYQLNREIEQEQYRLLQLRELATGTTTGISGMPSSGSVSNKTAIAADIADCEAIIDARIRESAALYNRLIRYISGIDDSLTRRIFMLRFIDGFSWQQVAGRVGGGNTDESVKKVCYRYIDKT